MVGSLTHNSTALGIQLIAKAVVALAAVVADRVRGRLADAAVLADEAVLATRVRKVDVSDGPVDGVAVRTCHLIVRLQAAIENKRRSVSCKHRSDKQ